MSREILTPPLTMAPKFKRRMRLHELGLCGLPTEFMQGAQAKHFYPDSMLEGMTQQAIDAGLYSIQGDCIDTSDHSLIVRTTGLPLAKSTTHSSPAFVRTSPDVWRDLSSKAVLDDEALRQYLQKQNHWLVHLEQQKLQRRCVHGRFITDNTSNAFTQLDLITGVTHARGIDHMKPYQVSPNRVRTIAPSIHELRVGEGFPSGLIEPTLEEVEVYLRITKEKLMADSFGMHQRLTCEFRFFPKDVIEQGPQLHIMDFLPEN